MLRPFTVAPLALYIHVPFCRSRCSYCAFNTYAGLEALIPAYVAALCREITWLGIRTGGPQLSSIYLGGGTPSLLSAAQVGGILTATTRAFSLHQEAEISLECNPDGIDHTYLAAIRAHGVNRLSIGAQTAQPGELKMFGRGHTWADVMATVGAARLGGFENISLDLIYGAPGQTLSTWQDTLQQSVACTPAHLSLYALSLEPGTALARRVTCRCLVEDDLDIAADLYDAASEFLAECGYRQYEISNWARPGFECVHNLQYWRRIGGYLAVGAGAYGYLDQIRYGAVDSIPAYIEQVETSDQERKLDPDLLSLAADPEKFETLDEQVARAETMILGLRLLQEGVAREPFKRRFGGSPEAYYSAAIKKLMAQDMLRADATHLALQSRARLVANQVMVEFV